MKDRTPLLSLSTVADAKISNPPWVNFQSGLIECLDNLYA
ncbi:hypothetical protein PS928_06179 [Pseudomonas fluorescens]|uniref:Uncharacterized protein n=1 Tax=Pseudomonas fluorescens TaxID=294 RepID=A0A5E7VSU6_PSEFL|nr:hypothetical protein PS928_06179 [Pseudomonas fluorescens]